MNAAALLLAGLIAGQGEAVRLAYPQEPGLISGRVSWMDQVIPMANQGDTWVTVIGVDLEVEPGEYPVAVALNFADGTSRMFTESVEVTAREFPTTRLTVAPKYVELSAENQARADAEAAEISAIYKTITPEAYWRETFQVPVPGVTGGRNFGHRRYFNNQARAPHSGADLTAAEGTPIHAANRGRVVLAKNLFFSGNAVFIDHGLGVYSVYLHLSDIQVQTGQMLERDQVLGLAGATGRVTGPHLHWGVRISNARVDPFSLLGL